MGQRFKPPNPPPAPTVDRRSFLRLSLAATAALGCGADNAADSAQGGGSGGETDTGTPETDPSGTCGPEAPTASGAIDGARSGSFSADPFTLGVASGDPLHDRVILWTRLAVTAADVDATPAESVDVIWEISASETFGAVLQQGLATAEADLAHSVHIDVDGLDADTVYWYRFRVGDFTSPVGRTKTLPCADARPDGLRLGFGSCQRYSAGWYVAHRDIAAQELDLFIFLGDYIYESGGSGVRDHEAGEPFDLMGYRNRYGHYRSDPDLQAAHASAPWMPIWDDHEVDNNHAGPHTDGGDPAAWTARRAAAYRAWYEHMPVRMEPPTSDALPIYRHATVGDLAQIVLLDGRQYRDPQPCDDQIGMRCDETDEERTFLGEPQEAWFEERVEAHAADWLLIANPVVMLPMDFGGVVLNPDQWDGYPTARQRLLDALAANTAAGQPVVFSGDIHASGVGYIPTDPFDVQSAAAVSEFIVPGITSLVEDLAVEAIGSVLAEQTHIAWWDFTRRGWLLVEVSRERLVARYRLTEDATDPDAVVAEFVAWVVEPGSPAPVGEFL